jgi:hypothetical protein
MKKAYFDGGFYYAHNTKIPNSGIIPYSCMKIKAFLPSLYYRNQGSGAEKL